MSEKMQRDTDLDLDRLLAEMAAEAPPAADGAFLTRILADAAREQPRPAGIVTAPTTPPAAARPAPGWFGSLAEVFGGRGALAGMMLATVTGLYLGLAQPAALTALYAETPLDSLDMIAGGDSLWTEVAQ